MEGVAYGGRYWDVDAARGVAIVMVVLYHLVYDLDNFGGYPIRSTSGFWAFFADASAFAFVFLTGLSLALRRAKSDAVSPPRRSLFGQYLRRGFVVFSYGMLITLVFWTLSYGYVVFGILHLIGASIVLAYPLLRLRLANLLLGMTVVAVGVYVQAEEVAVGGVAGVLLAPLGVLPEGLSMPDYRPLLPWFGVVILGLFFGNAVYLAWRNKMPHPAGPRIAAPVTFLGRHTLPIYLSHQPILVAVLWALGIVSF